MKWKVIWQPSVEQQVASFWLNPAWRAELNQVTAAIDRQLQIDPFAVGESRLGDMRIMFEPPYGVYFFIHEPSLTVYVLRIWRYDSHI